MPPAIYIALPAMDEAEHLPLLIADMMAQSYTGFRLFVCINQPDSYWQLPEKQSVCKANMQMIHYLNALNDSRIRVFDKASPGSGWTGGLHHIGTVRRFLMDAIAAEAEPADIIVSMDADTRYEPQYLQSILENFEKHPSALALSVPYYHPLTGNEALDRAMLRYEIYMRSYAINMWRIGSPYCFTALGSAIALPVWAYRAVGGITPKKSGEDFYFLQKLVKNGTVLHWSAEMAYPAARLSDRVFFGTGPALIKGLAGNWDSYPVYDPALFDAVEGTYRLFGQLFEKDIATPLDEFLLQRSGQLPWAGLRKNFKTRQHFERACHEKIDGLRILQYMKENHTPGEEAGRGSLMRLMKIMESRFPECSRFSSSEIDFSGSDIQQLNDLRDVLFDVEMKFRQNGC